MTWRERRRWRRLATDWGREAVFWNREDISREANIIGTLRFLPERFHRDFIDSYMVGVLTLATRDRSAADDAFLPLVHAANRYRTDTKE